jgi:hypothetical protein
MTPLCVGLGGVRDTTQIWRQRLCESIRILPLAAAAVKVMQVFSLLPQEDYVHSFGYFRFYLLASWIRAVVLYDS